MKYGKILSKAKLGYKTKFFNNLIFSTIISILLNGYNFESYIELKINKTGIIQFYNKYENNFFFFSPSKININGENLSDVNNVYDFNNTNNIVQLIWENTDFKIISYMFYNCSSIIEIDLSHFNFSNIRYMDHMFSECIELRKINFSNINITSVETMNSMFKNCKSLTSLVSFNFDTKLVKDMSYLFSNCSSFTSLNLFHFDTSNVVKMEYMFYNCQSLENLNLFNFDTTKVTFMNSMFFNCSKLTYLNLSNFNTSKVNSTSYMFNNCQNLTFLDLSNFNTSRVQSMESMFSNCTNLREINMSNFNTANVILMNNIFYRCSSLETLNISNFDTKNVINMRNMFMGCSKLESLDISNFNTKEVRLMDNMFRDCNSLKNLNIRNFDLSRVNSSNNMFSGSNNLLSINFGKGILGQENIFSSISNNITLCINKDVNSVNLTKFNITNSCYKECIHEYPFYDTNKDKCVGYCDINDLFNNLCLLNYNKEEYTDDFIYNNIKRNISNFNTSLLLNKNIFEIKGKHATFKITDNIDTDQANKNYRNLESCINILKNHYNNQVDDNLIILIIDIISEDPEEKKKQKSFYEFYHQNTKLNAEELCENMIKNDIPENCSSYSIESLIKNSCIECKNGYFPKYEDDVNNSNLKKCYKDLEGYYLNKSIQKYKQCYQTCKTCKQNGNNFMHNCLKCNNDYPFIYGNNCYEFCHHNFYNESTNVYQCLEEPKCIGKKLILNNEECVDGCPTNGIYKYEFQKRCYKECPSDSLPSEKNKFLCEVKCPPEKPYENLINQQCIEKCDIKDRFNNLCKQNYISSETIEENLSAKIIENIKNGTMKGVISQVLKTNKTVVIQNGEEAHLISALSGNLQRADFSSIDFGSCEQLIRTKNGINDDEELLLYEVEHTIKEFNIPIIEYVLFTENCTTQLDLSICNNVSVQYYIPNKINDKDLDKHDPSSDFYNDECNKESTEDGVDMTPYSKKNYYNNNYMSLCEKGCTFKGLDSNKTKIICDCNIKGNMTYNGATVNKDNLLNKIETDKSSSNLKVTNCLGNVFNSPKKLVTNSGFIVLTIILGIFIIIFILFCTKGKRNLEYKLDEVIYNKFEKELKKGKKNSVKEKASIEEDINPQIKNKKRKRRKPKITNAQKKNSVSIKSSKSSFVPILPAEQNNLDLINNNDNIYKNKLTTNENNINSQIEDKPNENNDYEMNNLVYIQAIKYDKRTCCDYYCSLLKNKQLFLFTFCSFNDYNSGIIKKFIFFLSFAIHYTISALFFDDNNMNQIYEDKGKYNISYQMPRIILSVLASNVVLRVMLETLILTDRSVLYVKQQSTRQLAEIEKEKILKCVNIKFAIFFILNFILLILFWFYLVSFNGTYENTQIYLIENTFIGFAFSLVYPFFWNIIPAALRMLALGTIKPENGCLYMASKICQII